MYHRGILVAAGLSLFIVVGCGESVAPSYSLNTSSPTPAAIASAAPASVPTTAATAAGYTAAEKKLYDSIGAAIPAFFSVYEADPMRLSLVWERIAAADQAWVNYVQGLSFSGQSATQQALTDVQDRAMASMAAASTLVTDPFDRVAEQTWHKSIDPTYDEVNQTLRDLIGATAPTPIDMHRVQKVPTLEVGQAITVYLEGPEGTLSYVPIATVGVRYAEWAEKIATKTCTDPVQQYDSKGNAIPFTAPQKLLLCPGDIGSKYTPPVLVTPPAKSPVLAVMIEIKAFAGATIPYCFDQGWTLLSNSKNKISPSDLTLGRNLSAFGVGGQPYNTIWDFKFPPAETLCGTVNGGKSGSAPLQSWLVYDPPHDTSLTLSYYRDWVTAPYVVYNLR